MVNSESRGWKKLLWDTEKTSVEVSVDRMSFSKMSLDLNLAALALNFVSYYLKSAGPMKFYFFGVDFRNIFMGF